MVKCIESPNLTEIIATVMEKIINYGLMPQIMNVGVIVPLIKDPLGDPGSLENIRPITLSDTIATIYEKFIMSELESTNQSCMNQFGFKQNSSTNHAIFVLKENMRWFSRRKRKGYGVFLDFSKAFDKVNRYKLLNKLIGKLDPFIWLSLLNYYEIAMVCIFLINLGFSILFKTGVGVKQGGPLSPILFNIYIDELIIIIVDSKLVITINRIVIGILVYADDTTIVCETPEQIKLVLKIIEDYCEKHEIQINAKKTVWMKFGETVKVDKVTNKVIEKPSQENELFRRKCLTA